MADNERNILTREQLREKIASFPATPGVYLMKDAAGVVLYVGKAKTLRSRVASYFQPSADLASTRGPQIAAMIRQVVDIDIITCENEVEALLAENRLIKDIQPSFNSRLTDGKSFPYVEITSREDFPGVYITRTPSSSGTKLYGPFVNVRGLRAAMQALQKVFLFRTCSLEIDADDEKRRFFRPCLLHSIKQCSAPCADRISKEDYRRDIQRLRNFMDSKRSLVLRQLHDEMQQAASELRFEDAARLRDRIEAFSSLSLAGNPTDHVQPEVFHYDARRSAESLGRLLKLDQPPHHIEGIDIATIQGSESCGSLVCFIDGSPFKEGYRRFRIKNVTGVDDYAMIREVVLRRYRNAGSGTELYPDLILIDGGKGQLHAADEAFAKMDIPAPTLISLAKRDEEIFIRGQNEPIRLPRTNPALKLLQHVRDEAHRFAQHYHHILRRKATFDEDDTTGRA